MIIDGMMQPRRSGQPEQTGTLGGSFRFRELMMRYFPAALALSLALAVTGSIGQATVAEPVDPRASVLLNDGRSAMAHGDVEDATGLFESALVIEPGYTGTLVALGDAARKAGLQGKAIHYYRVALARDPNDLAALGGEGGAFAEKGATDKARADLARLEGLCGKDCSESRTLAQAIAKGALPRLVTAETAKPEPAKQAN